MGAAERARRESEEGHEGRKAGVFARRPQGRTQRAGTGAMHR